MSELPESTVRELERQASLMNDWLSAMRDQAVTPGQWRDGLAAIMVHVQIGLALLPARCKREAERESVCEAGEVGPSSAHGQSAHPG